AALDRAAKLPDGAAAAALARAQILFMHGDKKGAEKALGELIKREPENAVALSALGSVLAADNRYKDSLSAFRRAAALAPGDPSLHYKLAIVLHDLGRDGEARGECAIALAAAPGNPKVRELMAAIGNRAPE
ncbi:MAG: tetratricopeptide repeat protein, partial [Candidatus Binataceae bacterium]